MMDNRSAEVHGWHSRVSPAHDVVAFVERGKQDHVEFNRPDAVAGFLESARRTVRRDGPCVNYPGSSDHTSPMDLRDQLQASLSAYTIERELAGGMSRVFVAEDMSLGRRVVVKVLPAELSGGVSVERFRREIALAARLQHPHIVPLLSTGEIDGLLYYTMPFVEGDSLRARLARGELPIPETISVLRDVARALEYAHAKGVTHRDIKPDNVLLAGTSAVITDFGVAKAISDATTVGTVTSVGIAIGTPAYMAPEQAAGDPATDQRADIYAFGMMAYEMLAGHAPFAGRTAQAMLAAHAVETPTSIAALRPATPPRLAELVMRCVEKRPGDRPQSAAEIVRVLESATSSGGLTPVHVSSVPAAPPTVRIGARTLAAVAASILLVAIAAAGVWRARAHAAEDELRSIAVLPFDNTTRDTAYDYLEDGITDHVRDALNATPGLRVKARSSSRQLTGNAVRQIGAKLGVGAVLLGTVTPSRSVLHVTAELVRASDESALWSGTFDAKPDDVAALQDTIVRAIVGHFRLGTRPASAQVAASLRRSTSDAMAYDLFLRGRFAYDRFDIPQAEALFRAALARDPRFARAEGFLAMTQANAPVIGLVSLDSALRLTREHAEHALSIDSTVVEAYIAESFILTSDMRLVEAIAPLEKALAFDSTNADLLANYALALAQVGRIPEAVVQAQRARDRDPLYASAVGILGYVLALAHHLDEGLAYSRAAVDLEPTGVLGRRGLAFGYTFSGMPDSALAAFQKAFSLDSMGFGGRANLMFGYAVAGRRDEAERQRAILQREPGGNSPDYRAVMVGLSFGDYDAAMTALQRGVANREPLFSNVSLPCDPLFDPLKASPRFARLMQQLGARTCPPLAVWPIPARAR